MTTRASAPKATEPLRAFREMRDTEERRVELRGHINKRLKASPRLGIFVGVGSRSGHNGVNDDKVCAPRRFNRGMQRHNVFGWIEVAPLFSARHLASKEDAAEISAGSFEPGNERIGGGHFSPPQY